jgi:mRNA-degrading endonuclease RelE of RelBE toxin-antitoxin system
MARSAYEIQLTPAATREFKKLDNQIKDRLREALRTEAARLAAGSSGKRGSKRVKTIRGRKDQFIRMRVGDHRVMFDALDDERTLLVLGIVHRKDLDRWVRGASRHSQRRRR